MAETLIRAGERLAAPPPSAVRRLRHAIGGFLYRVPAARLALLLGPVLLWMVVIYLGSLGLLFITSFWRQDSVTGAIVQSWGLTNYQFLVQEDDSHRWYRAGRHGHRHRPRDSDRLLRGAHRNAANPHPPAALDRAATVVELPRSCVCVADHLVG